MARIEPVAVAQLRWQVHADALPFETTRDLEDLSEVIGQPRATEALRFGLGIHREGYHLFLAGEPGTGRHASARKALAAQAAEDPVPPDWCYVHDFDHPHRPKALRLPAGAGVRLQQAMERLVDDLRSAIPAAFEAESYRARRGEIEHTAKEEHEHELEELGKQAEGKGLALLRTPGGIAIAATREGQVLERAEFDKLPKDEQERIDAAMKQLHEALEHVLRRVPQRTRELREKIRALDEEVTRTAVAQLVQDLEQAWREQTAVVDYLHAVQQAVIRHSDDFRPTESDASDKLLGLMLGQRADRSPGLRRFQVNVLVDHSQTRGAPVVHADNPTHPELVGRVEHAAHMGALVTDFTLIQAGALHKANGGYLLLDVRKVLLHPFAWEGLKNALAGKQIRIESIAQILSLVSTVSLEPEPIPLDLKVVLVGERLLYYLLQLLDPDFRDLFKVLADFDEVMTRTDEEEARYARFIATVVRREQLLPFDRGAVARVLEHGVRLADAQDRLTANMRDVSDLLREADYWARQEGREVVGRPDVQHAIDGRIRRSDRLRERLLDEVRQGTVLLATEGARVGQVNGLSVALLGDFRFGHPTRISARVRLGKGQVVDIQREVELGGPLHAKGVLILAAWLGARFCAERPLALAASLVFEQTYGPVEGDSASVAELCALVSALAEVPILQSLAVTGSVNQHGDVQPIGAVNEKIEGFFDTCMLRGLTGEQGVVIPASNVRHLMLRDDVVAACEAGQFRVLPVTTVDEAIELLTGVAAGEPDAQGRWPADSVNGKVDAKLAALAERARAFGRSQAGELGEERGR